MVKPWQPWDHWPPSLPLPGHEVHVWKLDLEQAKDQLSYFYTLLSGDEQERADRFRVEPPRQQYVVSRGMLRLLLSRYLQLPARELQFGYSDRGKPFLTSAEIQFNVSHTHGLALYGVAQSTQVGIDVEKVRVMDDVEQLARRFFSTPEYEAIVALPPEARSDQFFQYWTYREAYLKAIGEGLVGLQSLQIHANAEQAPQIWLPEGTTWQAAHHWSLYPLALGPDYYGAVAIEGQNYQLECRVINPQGI